MLSVIDRSYLQENNIVAHGYVETGGKGGNKMIAVKHDDHGQEESGV